MIQQTSLDQTGIAIFTVENGEKVSIPLFSLTPFDEADELSTYIEGEIKKDIFISNNLCDYKIEDEIRDYKKKNLGAIPEEFMDQLVLGFPFINDGSESLFLMSCYA